jgi:hypothetical protein
MNWWPTVRPAQELVDFAERVPLAIGVVMIRSPQRRSRGRSLRGARADRIDETSHTQKRAADGVASGTSQPGSEPPCRRVRLALPLLEHDGAAYALAW